MQTTIEQSKPSVLSSAELYLELGLCVIPVAFRQKRPIIPWEPYQHTRPTHEAIRTWFGDHKFLNIGIVCGPVSDNVTILDFDKTDAYHRFFDSSTLESSTPVVRTARGVHVWLRSVEVVSSFRVLDLGLDVIGQGKFALAPPSVHPSGAVYEFVSEKREPMLVQSVSEAIQTRCLELDVKFPLNLERGQIEGPAAGLSRVEKHPLSEEAKNKIVAALVPFWNRGRRNTLTMYLLGTFVKRGIVQCDAQDVIQRICENAKDEEEQERLRQVEWHYRKPPSAIPRLKGLAGLREVLGS